MSSAAYATTFPPSQPHPVSYYSALDVSKCKVVAALVRVLVREPSWVVV